MNDQDETPKPYNPAHVPLVACFNYENQRSDGARFYDYPVRGPNASVDAPDFSSHVEQQAYFYRAMSESEASGWLELSRQPFEIRRDRYLNDPRVQINGHQGWASYRQYAAQYLKNQAQYTHLLEVYAPDFIAQLKEIGVKTGKAEDGDMSWGVGETKSNGFKPDAATNGILKARYAELTGKSTSSKDLKKMSDEITPLIFVQSIRWAKLVNLKSLEQEKKKKRR